LMRRTPGRARARGRAVVGEGVPAAGVAGPAEHLHLARLDLGGVAGLTLLVLPLPRLERPLDIDLPALLEVLRADLGEAVPRDHAVPLRLLDEVAVAVLVGLVRGDVEVAHGRAAAGVAQLGVGAEVADEDDLVDSAACHSRPPVLLDLFGTRIHRSGVRAEVLRRRPAVLVASIDTGARSGLTWADKIILRPE